MDVVTLTNSDRVLLLTGTRVVGECALTREGCSGIGVMFFDRGFNRLDEMRHYGFEDGMDFLAALVAEFNGDYFRAVWKQ